MVLVVSKVDNYIGIPLFKIYVFDYGWFGWERIALKSSMWMEFDAVITTRGTRRGVGIKVVGGNSIHVDDLSSIRKAWASQDACIWKVWAIART